MRKSLFLLFVIAAVVFCSSCATTPSRVAVVNGVEITGADYQRALNGFLSNYGLTEESMSATLGLQETVEYKNNVIDELVLQELMLQYAADHHLDQIDEKDAAEIENKVSTYLEGLRSSFTADVEAEGSLEGAAAEKEVELRYKEYIDTYAYTEENLSDQFRKQLILDRVYEDVMSGCLVTDEEVESYYESELAMRENEDEEDPERVFKEYLTEVENGEVSVYIPSLAASKARYVKHVLIQLPSDITAQISEMEATGDTDGAAKLKEQAMQDLKKDAEEILAQARQGADFDTLIARYNQDPGVSYNPNGYLVYDGASFDSAFLEDALSLTRIGDVSSEPVESTFGYHIIKYAGVPKKGAVPFVEVKTEIANMLRDDKRTQFWDNAVESWQASAQVEKHQFRDS